MVSVHFPQLGTLESGSRSINRYWDSSLFLCWYYGSLKALLAHMEFLRTTSDAVFFPLSHDHFWHSVLCKAMVIAERERKFWKLTHFHVFWSQPSERFQDVVEIPLLRVLGLVGFHFLYLSSFIFQLPKELLELPEEQKFRLNEVWGFFP